MRFLRYTANGGDRGSGRPVCLGIAATTQPPFAAVSGLQAHQTFMDVVGNNIANVNTTGYKAATVEFEDLLSQTINGAGSPTAGRPPTSPPSSRAASTPW